MTKLLSVGLILFAFVFMGCSNIQTDRDRVASAAITYESALDGLIAARKSGLINDEQYRKIDPVVDMADSMLKSLKARLDEDENVSDETLDRLDVILDSILQMLMTYEGDVSVESSINEAKQLKFKIQTMKAT